MGIALCNLSTLDNKENQTFLTWESVVDRLVFMHMAASLIFTYVSQIVMNAIVIAGRFREVKYLFQVGFFIV